MNQTKSKTWCRSLSSEDFSKRSVLQDALKVMDTAYTIQFKTQPKLANMAEKQRNVI